MILWDGNVAVGQEIHATKDGKDVEGHIVMADSELRVAYRTTGKERSLEVISDVEVLGTRETPPTEVSRRKTGRLVGELTDEQYAILYDDLVKQFLEQAEQRLRKVVPPRLAEGDTFSLRYAIDVDTNVLQLIARHFGFRLPKVEEEKDETRH